MERPTARKLMACIVAAFMISTLLVIALPAGALACGFQRWYLPEGYTGENFDTYILIQNPNPWKAKAAVTFMTDSSVTEPGEYDLPENSRTTIKVDDEPGMENQNVSTMVESPSGVVVERAMYFNDPGGKKAGGSDSIGANEASRLWYLAEGYTGEGFDTFLLIMNPNEQRARVKVSYITPQASGGRAVSEEPGPAPGPGYITKYYDIEPVRRFTIHVDEVPGLESTEVSFKVESVWSSEGRGGAGEEEPLEPVSVVAERSMYFTYHGFKGGHASIGAPCASNTWYLPEGRTAGDYDTYVTVMNPNETATHVKASFMVPQAGAGQRRANPYEPEPEPEPDKMITREYTVRPFERFTIPVDEIPGLEATDVSTMVQSWREGTEGCSAASCENPVVVERSMYFARGNSGDGHNTIGAMEKREYWLMAEGYTAEGFDTWILIQNPNESDVRVQATFMKPGGEPLVKEYDVRKLSRLTIAVDRIEGFESTEVSTKLQVLGAVDGGRMAACEYGIVAERAMYFEYNGIAGGHCSLGVGE